MQHTHFAALLLLALVTTPLQAQINYLNCDPPPAHRPVVFAPGVVSLKNRYEEKIAFTPDGKEVFFGTHPDPKVYFRPVLMHAKFSDGKWTTPEKANFVGDRLLGWPLVSPSDSTLFMEEVAGKTPNGVVGQIAYSNRKDGTWSEPKVIHPDAKAKEGFGLAQITNDNTFFFYDRFDRIAYSSKIVDGKHTKPEPLHYRINPAVEFFVSPDNDYIIFQPIHWGNKFHISFREGENQWSMPKPLSIFFKKENGWDGSGACGPYVSPDKEYFFFCMKGDIYWVKTDFIEALKNHKG